MNDKCPLCGISVNEDTHDTGELLLSVDGKELECLLGLTHVHCIRALIVAAQPVVREHIHTNGCTHPFPFKVAAPVASPSTEPLGGMAAGHPIGVLYNECHCTECWLKKHAASTTKGDGE